MFGTGVKFPMIFELGAKDGASAKISQTVKGWQRMSSGLGQAGRGLTLGLTAPILAAGAAASSFAIQFEKEMGNVATLIDTNVESIDDMGKKVLEIGKRTPVALSDMTTALYDVRSASISAADQFKVLEGSARLGVVGLGTTKEATDLVTSSINAFNLKGKEQDRVYDTIFKTVKSGKTTISGLAQGFGGVASTVAASGIQLDDYLASVSAMTAVGKPAAQAHTQLKAVIAGLTRTTADTSRVFGRLGVKDFNGLIEKSGGLVPALGAVSDVLKDNKASILKVVGSTEALDAILTLSGDGAKRQADALDLMRNKGDMLSEAFDKQASTRAAKIEMMKNKIEASAIRIGNKLLPIMERIAGKAEKVVDWFDKLSDGQQDFALGLAGVAAVAGPAMGALSGVINVVTLLSGKTNDAGEKVGGLGGAFRNATAASASASGPIGKLAGVANSLIGPFGLAAAAVGSLYLAYSQFQQLDKTLSASGGVGGTIDAMIKHGTWDIAEASDKEANERARNRVFMDPTKMAITRRKVRENQRAEAAKGFDLSGKKPSELGRGFDIPPPQASETKIVVDMKNVPKGTRADVQSSKGPATVDLSVGYNMSPGG